MPIKDFERALSEAVDEALSSLGENRKQTVYSKLEESFSIKKAEIPSKIEAFSKAIEQVLDEKAYSVETLIVNLLNEKIGTVLEKEKSEGFTFAEHVKHARERLYTEFIENMQSGLAVFHFENVTNLGSFMLVAANSAAEKTTGMTKEELVGKTIAEIFPETQRTDIPKLLADVIRGGRARNLGEFDRDKSNDDKRSFSVAAFPLSNGYVGLVIKNVLPKKQAEEIKNDEEMPGTVTEEKQWRWDADTGGRYVSSDRSRSMEQWTKREVDSEPHAKYFSARGMECLKTGDIVKARELFYKAEEAYSKLGKADEAFENASWRLKTYFLEEKMPPKEFFSIADEYVRKYSDYAMDERFVENLAHLSQWKGYQQSEERRFDAARASYADAEEMFLTLKKREKALFNAAQRVLTYTKENRPVEYVRLAEQFFDKYKETSRDRHYKEVLAHYYSYKADESEDSPRAAEFLKDAERLFLEIDQRQLAFENACKLVDFCWSNVNAGNENKECFEATERFFEEYRDFSEHEKYKNRLSKYYLLQARTLASQLKQVLY
ncbi:MAG TPA: PAS domain S-box protein [Candidatus Bathyarchaeia archaeon]